MLVLSEKQVQSLIDIQELIAALEQAHIQYSTGKAVMPVCLVVPLPQIHGRITSMPGYLNEDRALGMKVVTYFQDKPQHGLPAIMAECGDILLALKEQSVAQTVIHGEIGEVLAGTKSARARADDITLYKSVGIAIQDVAAAQLVYHKALERNVGTNVAS